MRYGQVLPDIRWMNAVAIEAIVVLCLVLVESALLACSTYGCSQTGMLGGDADGRPFGLWRSSAWRHAAPTGDEKVVVEAAALLACTTYGCGQTGMLSADADGRGCSLGGPSQSASSPLRAWWSNRAELDPLHIRGSLEGRSDLRLCDGSELEHFISILR